MIAGFLKDMTKAWDKAAQGHRNRLRKYLLESIWIKNKMIIGVILQSEFIPFFDLQYDGKSKYRIEVRPRGAPGYEVHIAYLVEKLCPQIKYIAITPRRLSTSQQVQVTRDRKDKSLRELARDYGVSHETVRRVLKTNEAAE